MKNYFFSARRFAAVMLVWSIIIMVCSVALAQTAKPRTAPKPQPAAPAAKPMEPGDDYPRPPKPTRQYTIGVLLPHLASAHFVGQAYGYINEAQELGVKVILFEAGGYDHLDRQIAQIEDLAAQKVDAIVMGAVSGPGTVGAVDHASLAGIPVFTCNSTSDSQYVVSRIRSDDDTIGQMQADVMGRVLKGRGNVVMLPGPAGTSWAENRAAAFKRRLAEKFPGVKVIGMQYAMSTPVEGLRIMEDFLQTYPRIDGVYNGADTTAIGSAQAVLASGNAGKIAITTTDFQRDTENFLRSGVITAAVIQQTVVIGRWGIRAAVNYLEKRPVPPNMTVPLLLATKDDIEKLDMRGIRAPEGWKPPSR
jgi:ABC-type sugar transport system substrate-binding protein